MAEGATPEPATDAQLQESAGRDRGERREATATPSSGHGTQRRARSEPRSASAQRLPPWRNPPGGIEDFYLGENRTFLFCGDITNRREAR